MRGADDPTSSSALHGAAGEDLAAILDRLLSLLADRVVHRISQPVATPVVDRWLSTKEAAAYLGMHPDSLRRLASAKQIPYEQDGPGCLLHFRLSDIDAWRESGGTYSRAVPASTRLPRARKAA